jgi:dipeptidyl aminopeptidase/acylaminoacyl peptidase
MSILAVALVLAVPQVGTPASDPVPAARRAITEMDLFRFVWIGDPRISPDGSDVVFVRVAVNRKLDGYETALWMVPADGSAAPRPFSSGPRDSAPRWSPDGRRLAFLRAVEKDGKPQPAQIHVMERAGGEARAVTDLPKGATAPVWSPDGRTLAFTRTTNAKDLAAPRGAPAAGEAERESDVRVITRAVYR